MHFNKWGKHDQQKKRCSRRMGTCSDAKRAAGQHDAWTAAHGIQLHDRL